MHGDLKYPPDFTHLDYADPAAPKGGDVRLASIGTFDSLNPFILKGVPASGLGSVFDTLAYNTEDEPFSEYGLIAESIQMPEDRSWVAYTLRPEARFHDGSPITPADVIFSLRKLQTEGHPFYRAYYGAVAGAEQTGSNTVRFTFTEGANRELPLIIGQMPVLPKHYWADREFNATTLEAPLGSGPYRVASVDPGRSVTYERVPDYWARDLPVNRGRFNFDRIRYDYYRDATVALQAFKAGEYDFRAENIAKNWAAGYEGPALRSGLIVMEEIPHQRPTGMQGFLMNSRRAVFQDPRVRRALAYAFDFEWMNRTLFYEAYTRTHSYFSNSELASSGLPGPAELALLEPHRDSLPAEVFSTEYRAPGTDGSGNPRRNLRAALQLLREAGYEVRDGVMVHRETGAPLSFELLLVSPSFERVALPFQKALERLGVQMQVRTVDEAQYQRRLNDFDFDMIVAAIGQSLSPGNEQRDFWHSSVANTPGSRNYAGISDPVVDELVEAVIAAPDRDALVHRTRALDRVLLWGHYVIPHWHTRVFRLAYWDKFGRPEISPPYGLAFDSWWVDPARATRLAAEKPRLKR
jgi:microcin C transport system substrate-binding protein